VVSSAWMKAFDDLLDNMDTYPGLSSDWAGTSRLDEAQVRVTLSQICLLECLQSGNHSLFAFVGTNNALVDVCNMCIHTHLTCCVGVCWGMIIYTPRWLFAATNTHKNLAPVHRCSEYASLHNAPDCCRDCHHC